MSLMNQPQDGQQVRASAWICIYHKILFTLVPRVVVTLVQTLYLDQSS